MKKIFTLLILVAVLSTNAQIIPAIEWQKSLGSESNDTAGGVAITADGGYIVFGSVFGLSGNVSTHYGSADYWIAKLDAEGTLEWEKTYGGSDYDAAGGLRIEASKIKQTSDGGYILGGSSMSFDFDVSANFGGTDVWIVKIDTSGNIEWEKNYGSEADDYFSDIQETNEGGFIITSASSDYNTLIFDSTITKIDIQGNVEWTNSYGEGEFKYSNLYSITQTSDGGYITTGWTNADNSEATPEDEILPGFYNTSRLWVLKISASGAFEWAKTYGGSNIEEGYCIIETGDGSFVVSGMTYSGDGDISAHPDADNAMSPWILKLDNSGEIIWEKAYGLSSNAVAVKVMPDGNYVIGGSFVQSIFSSNNGDVINGQGGTDEFLMKLNQENGNIIWTKTMGGTLQDNLWGFTLTPDNGFITIGSSRSLDGDVTGNIGGFDYWVVKLGPDCEVPVLTTETAYTACSDEELTLSATSEGNSINWYSSKTETDILFTGSDFVTPVLTEDVSYWVSAVSTTGCVSEKSEVVVTVNTRPGITVDNSTVSICENTTATLTAATTSGNLIVWYDSAIATQEIASGTEFTTPQLSQDTSYWVQAYNPQTQCVSDKIQITLAVSPVPLLIIDTTAFNVCANATALLTATTTTGNLIVWYDSINATQWIASGEEFTTPELTQNTSYWVQAYNPESHCTSDRIEITIIVTPVSLAVVEFSYVDSVCILDNNPSPIVANGFVWGGTFSAASGLSINATTGEIDLSLSNPGTYTVTYTFAASGCLLGNSDSAVIVITDSKTPVISFSYGEICTKDIYATPILNDGFTEGGTFSSTSGLSIDAATGEIDVRESDPGTYVVLYQVLEDINSCTPDGKFESQAVINICQLQRGISPNGDGLNDWFDLTGLEVSDLGIFNRYGKEVYSKSSYTKEWGGQDGDGKELPDGTYYYAIEKTNGDKLTGWIYINRNH